VVADPGGDRLFTELPHFDSDVVLLTGIAHRNSMNRVRPWSGVATSDALSRALVKHPDLMVFLGHVGQVGSNEPAAAHLVLADRPLTAKDWIHDPHRWPAPRRVVLMGCDSGAHHHAEASGLATAALWAGASEVAVSAWNLLNVRSTANLATDLARTPPGESLACALRRLMVGPDGYLRRWRAGGDAKECSPLIWASLAVVGASGSRTIQV
jgi:CHAT domain-containing protein